MFTDKELKVIGRLGHSQFTSEYLEDWANRDVSETTPDPEALRIMEAKGYLEAVKYFAALPGAKDSPNG